MIYVLIVIAGMGPHHERSLATHEYNNWSICQSSAAALEKQFKQYDMHASCQAKGYAI